MVRKIKQLHIQPGALLSFLMLIFSVYNLDAPKSPGRQVSGDTLTFRAVVPDSAAVFQCNASNQYGYIMANAFLAVMGKR